MKLTSPAFTQGGKIPRKYSCQGEDINPPLEIHDVPAGTVSLALIVDDPDVPPQVRQDRMWVHWVVFNLDPTAKEIKENCGKIGTSGTNTGGEQAYMGPCPPDREHRYFFKLYALDIKLNLKAGATKEELLKAMEGHVLSHTELMGRYEKV